MLMLRRHMDRQLEQHGKNRSWITEFPGEHARPPFDKPGIITSFREITLPPGGSSTWKPDANGRIVSFMVLGAIDQEDALGHSSSLLAGEVQHTSIQEGQEYTEVNRSKTVAAHLFRITMRPRQAGASRRLYRMEQKLITRAQRNNQLHLIVSRDGQEGALSLDRDAVIYASRLEQGRHLVHALLPGRYAWLHVINGEVGLQDATLVGGDSAGVASQPAVSLTCKKDAEIILINVKAAP